MNIPCDICHSYNHTVFEKVINYGKHKNVKINICTVCLHEKHLRDIEKKLDEKDIN